MTCFGFHASGVCFSGANGGSRHKIRTTVNKVAQRANTDGKHLGIFIMLLVDL
jgi:hypothetical protein